MSVTPEHDKLHAVKDESQAVGEFLDTCGYQLCAWREAGQTDVPRYVWAGGISRDNSFFRTTSTAGEPDKWDYLNGDAVTNPAFDEWEEGYYPVAARIEQILARHYGIDLDRLEEEKRAMLDDQRAANAARSSNSSGAPEG